MTATDIQQQIDDYLSSSLGKLVVGNYDDAVRELKAAEALDRENPEILYNLGICYSRMGLFNTAVSYFEKIIRLPSTFVEILTVYKILAYIYIKLERFSKAEKLLNHVLKYTENDTETLNMKGFCLEKQEKYTDSIEIYERVVDLESENPTACNSLAYIYALQGSDLDRALQLIERVLKKYSKNPAYIDTAGFIYMKRGDLDTAEELITEAYSQRPFSHEIMEHYELIKKINKKN
jgi:tetratricopeptide (TPR) repeat protein